MRKPLPLPAGENLRHARPKTPHRPDVSGFTRHAHHAVVPATRPRAARTTVRETWRLRGADEACRLRPCPPSPGRAASWMTEDLQVTPPGIRARRSGSGAAPRGRQRPAGAMRLQRRPARQHLSRRSSPCRWRTELRNGRAPRRLVRSWVRGHVETRDDNTLSALMRPRPGSRSATHKASIAGRQARRGFSWGQRPDPVSMGQPGRHAWKYWNLHREPLSLVPLSMDPMDSGRAPGSMQRSREDAPKARPVARADCGKRVEYRTRAPVTEPTVSERTGPVPPSPIVVIKSGIPLLLLLVQALPRATSRPPYTPERIPTSHVTGHYPR